MDMMKRIDITTLLACSLLLCGCYEDYVKDFDHASVYSAFQYDLRTFVVGEGARFDFTVGLTGVLENDRSRDVRVVVDDELVTGDLPSLLGIGDVASFSAYDGMLGKARFGALSQSYVTNEVKGLGAGRLTPLPADCYTVTGLDGLSIAPGRHTATVTVRATDKLFEDERCTAPHYAIGFRILSADADQVPPEKSFEVIAVKCECKYYGYWYHGGERIVVDKLTGKEIGRDSYPIVLPQDDSKVYTLTTTGPYSVKTNKIGQRSGSFFLEFDGGEVHATCSDPEVVVGYCYTNDAPCIQDRVIHLNYSYDNGDGTLSVVSDSLAFRNRIRDGISEWQDENPENYQQ